MGPLQHFNKKNSINIHFKIFKILLLKSKNINVSLRLILNKINIFINLLF